MTEMWGIIRCGEKELYVSKVKPRLIKRMQLLFFEKGKAEKEVLVGEDKEFSLLYYILRIINDLCHQQVNGHLKL